MIRYSHVSLLILCDAAGVDIISTHLGCNPSRVDHDPEEEAPETGLTHTWRIDSPLDHSEADPTSRLDSLVGGIERIANAWNYLSILLHKIRDYPGAEKAARNALDVYSREQEPKSDNLGSYHLVLSRTFTRINESSIEAFPEFELFLEIASDGGEGLYFFDPKDPEPEVHLFVMDGYDLHPTGLSLREFLEGPRLEANDFTTLE